MVASIDKRVRTSYNRRDASNVDKRVSTCTDCRKGIFKERDTYLWTSRGLVHTRCNEGKDEIQETK